MQPILLNAVAIAVFAMTLSVYLGPLLHLSPFIPAAATLGVLGLVTVDGLTWQGRGLNLFLDIFASEQQRQRIIHHEAGHFLAAYCLGVPVTGYSLSAWEALQQGLPGSGGVQFDLNALSAMPQTPDNPLVLERFCTVWMAGMAAEMITYGSATGGESDRQQVQAMLRLARLSERVYAQKESWALLQAKNLIERHSNAYNALVKAMTERASVDDCNRVIQANL